MLNERFFFPEQLTPVDDRGSFCLFIILTLILTSISCPLAEIRLENTVFMAFEGGDLHVNSYLKIPPNQSSDILTCSDPSQKQIYNCVITATNGDPFTFNQTLELKNLTCTGAYFCQYKTAKTFWFLRVIGEHGELEPPKKGVPSLALFPLAFVLQSTMG